MKFLSNVWITICIFTKPNRQDISLVVLDNIVMFKKNFKNDLLHRVIFISNIEVWLTKKISNAIFTTPWLNCKQ